MSKITLAAATLALAVTFAPQAMAQDAAAGEKAFRACAACHTVEAGKNKAGPHLAGVVGRKAAAVEGFSYSKALQESGLTWDEATLDKWLADPKGTVPGNKMVYAGQKNEQTRKDLIAYLASK
ncbi:cytochrome c family protein [Azospirillum sp. SYSU D00513]|uniref:c-type cytochrome n=1 Tax=Azospirillum sp. SYSU D00513 TaxID=2812561 RepID=UPI001A964AB8|nr:cytochrome c family protein [Azospirillum sp. SYSU D00513]